MSVLFKIRIFKSLLLTACFLAFSAVAAASTITLDGILSPNEYSGSSSGSRSILWWNGHRSIYTQDAGNMNPLLWEINDNGGSFSLNLFFEVPTYARRMIWNDDAHYNGSNFDSNWGIPKEYLDAYLEGSHHSSGVNMSYGTQTGSEYFQLNGLSFPKIKWQDEDANGLNDNFTWKTSREYIIDNGLGTTSLSLQFDMTASIELMWNSLPSEAAAMAYVNNINDMELHLSDEARGLPPVTNVPESGSSMVLLLIALVSLAAYRETDRKKRSVSSSVP